MAEIWNVAKGYAEDIEDAYENGELIEYIDEHGYPPTTREIGEMVGLKSTSSVHAHLQRLLKEGKIETDAGLGVPRAIRIPGYKFTKVAG